MKKSEQVFRERAARFGKTVIEGVNFLCASHTRCSSVRELVEQMRRKKIEAYPVSPRFAEFQDPDYWLGERWLRDADRADWPMYDGQLVHFVRKVFTQCRRDNVPVYVHTAYRSPSLQKALQQAGASQLSSGPHQRAAAVDIVHANYHWNAPQAFWDYIGDLGRSFIRANQYDIQWGGEFRTLYDPAHWQLTTWRDMPLISENAVRDSVSGEVIQWKRSPFSVRPAHPQLSDGESYYVYLERNGRRAKTTR